MSSLHEPDEQLELYSLDRLPEDAMERVEEHVLICDYCRMRLDEIGEFAHTMRQSLRAVQMGRVPRGRGWFEGWNLKLVMGAAFAAAILLWVAAYRNTHRLNLAPVATLTLSAMRGATAQLAPAREYDLTLTGAGTENPRVDVVDAVGKAVWTGTGEVKNGDARIRIARELDPGTYFIRLKSSSGELLHEYGLNIKP